MGFIKEYRQLFSQLNKALDEWDALGVKPNDVRYAENMLNQFYEWVGKEPKNPDRFSSRLKLDDDQMEELEEIAQAIANMDIYASDEYDESFIKKFEKVKGKHNIETIEDYKNFIDGQQRFKDNVLIASVMDWYEYEKLTMKANKKGWNEERLNTLIIDVYQKYGYEGEQLYEFVYKHIR